MIEGQGLFNAFPAGEVHQVTCLTRMVLYRVQAGADRHAQPVPDWPKR